MLPNFNWTANTWHNVYALTGIGVGTGLLLHNAGVTNVYIWKGPTAPSGVDGIPFFGEPYVVDPGALGVWVRSMGAITLNVQEYAP